MGKKLVKELSFIDVFAVATGAMISSGIFILPGLAYARTGGSVFVAYLLAGALALTGVFSIAELASAMPKAGGDYYFIHRSLGPLFGTVSGLLSWFALGMKTAFAVIGIAEIVHLTTGLPVFPVGVAVTVFFTALNVVGVKEAGRAEVVVVLVLLLIMAVFIGGGMPHVEIPRFEPFARKNWNGILMTAGFVFVAYGGLLKVATLAEEVKRPKVNIPLGMFASLGVVTLIYVLVLIVTVGVYGGETLSGSLTPLADAARTFMGTPGFMLLSAAAFLAFISTANAGIMAASRYPFALSQDRLLPSFLAYIPRRFSIPVFSVLLTGGLIALAQLLPLEHLVKAASTVIVLTYVLAHVSVIILRESGIQNYRPSFRSPLYPGIQIVSMLLFLLLLIDMGMFTLTLSIGLIIAGGIFYLVYGRRSSKRHYALLGLVERLTNKALVTTGLEAELKEVLKHRDDVVYDRFDRLAEEAPVLDIEEAVDVDEAFRRAAGIMTPVLDIPPRKIHQLLQEREADSSTALSPFVAIPHIVVPGERRFALFLLRCGAGIRFNERIGTVQAMFILAGSRDERQFHLQALAAIAQIVQEKHFEERWRKARTAVHLRDILLLSTRRRMTN